MNLSKKILSGVIAVSLVASLFTACGGTTATENSNSGSTTSNADTNSSASENDDNSSAENSGTSADNESNGDSGSATVEDAPSNGTVLKWLSFYDLNTTAKDIVEQFNDAGYTVEYIATQSGSVYFEKQAQLVASDDSPDMVGYEWMSFPHGISKNLYMPIGQYFDFESPTWSGVKSMAESFNYGGKYYYIPFQTTPGVVLIYDATALENEGITEDPFELYQEGEWTWSKWKDLMAQWCNLGDDYYGVMPTGFLAMPFIVSTGMPLIDVDGTNKQIINNMKEPNVQRCQDFLQQLAKENMVYSTYEDPSTCLKSGKLMFAEFGLDWGYSSAAKGAPDSEIKFVPIPRDENADAYYMNTTTFGYLVPAGAKNVKAALKFMEISRLNEIDPENLENAKDEATAENLYYPKCPECGVSTADKTLAQCPECNADRRLNKNHVPMSEELYDLAQELKNPESEVFTFIFDDCFGFSQELTDMFSTGDAEGQNSILGGPFKNGESYTNIRDSYYGTVEAVLQPYRDLLSAIQ